MTEAVRQRYKTLDGLRGVAALYVVVRHFDQAFHLAPARFGYLAVDLFFILSGFVLAASYMRQFQAGMTVRDFLQRRIIRLYPLYLVGLGISAILLLIEVLRGRTSIATAGLMIGSAMLMLPSPTWSTSNALFPALIPAWSLFFELYVANTLFVFLRQYLERRLIISLLVIVSAIGLIVVSVVLGNLDGGPAWRNVGAGVPRVVFSFFLGVLIQQLHARHPPPWQVPALVVLISFCGLLVPNLNGIPGQVYELACVALFFPMLVYWGAGARERRPWLGELLGNASYAVYVIHFPLLALMLRAHRNFGVAVGRIQEAMFVAGVVALAVALHEWIDTPLRAALTRRLNARARARLAPSPLR